jgi:hypothetical protein
MIADTGCIMIRRESSGRGASPWDHSRTIVTWSTRDTAAPRYTAINVDKISKDVVNVERTYFFGKNFPIPSRT